MTTLQDLNISYECWQFIISKTYYTLDPDGWITRKQNEAIVYICNIHNEDGIFDWLLHDIIYQAIDGINKSNLYRIDQFHHGVSVMTPREKEFILFEKYFDETTARIAALQWIWQQEQKELKHDNP